MQKDNFHITQEYLSLHNHSHIYKHTHTQKKRAIDIIEKKEIDISSTGSTSSSGDEDSGRVGIRHCDHRKSSEIPFVTLIKRG